MNTRNIYSLSITGITLLLAMSSTGRDATQSEYQIAPPDNNRAEVPEASPNVRGKDGWAGAKVTKTDLLTGETNDGKFAYFFASVMTRAGCHVAKVEGERDKEVFVRRDGQRGKAYADIAHPVFSPDGSALGYAVRGAGGSRFIINDQEGPIFDRVMPDTFVFSNDGKRHAYLVSKAGIPVAVVDGVSQPEAGGDMVPWLQPPVFSADGRGGLAIFGA